MESTLIPFGEALLRLQARLPDTHPGEIAAWIWNGHLPAYRSPRLPACEENRASFLDYAARPEDWRDWWFAQEGIAAFVPGRQQGRMEMRLRQRQSEKEMLEKFFNSL